MQKQKALEKYGNQQFSHFFNGYTQALNKQHSRKGTLFMHPFKRKRVEKSEYFFNLVHDIHYNPVEAGLAKEIGAWKFSSYLDVSNDNSFIDSKEIIRWFGDRENFIYMHSEPPGKMDF